MSQVYKIYITGGYKFSQDKNTQNQPIDQVIYSFACLSKTIFAQFSRNIISYIN